MFYALQLFYVLMQVSFHMVLDYCSSFLVLKLDSFLFAWESYLGFGEDTLLK